MIVNPESDVDTESDSEHDPDSLIDGSNDLGILAAYDELKKKLEEVEKTLLEKVKMLDDRTRHLVQDESTSNAIGDYQEHTIPGSFIREDSIFNSEKDGEMECYPNDTFSFLALCGPISNPNAFFFGVAVFLVQMAFHIVLLLSILVPSWSSRDFIDGASGIFPGDVEPLVKLVQILSIVVHASLENYSMDDLITAVNLFPDINKARNDDPLGGLLLSAGFRFVQGITANIATFFLIFTSLTAKEVILNFAAINFISRIDNAGFSSILAGHYGVKMRNTALQVTATRLPNCVTNCKYPFLRAHVVMFLTFSAMIFAGFYFALLPQTNGMFLTNTFRLALGTGSGLEAYNGCYRSKKLPIYQRLGGKRPVYFSLGHSAIFGYCKPEQKWYLFKAGHDDACKAVAMKQIFAHSSRSLSFDIQTIFSDPWVLSSGTPLETDFLIEGVGIEDGCGKSTRDGICDPVLNIAEFEYDGGDCCAATCKHPLCGFGTIKEGLAFGTVLRDIGDGYQQCSDPDMVDVLILVHNVIRTEYYKDAQFGVVDSTAPQMKFECDGVTHLSLEIQEGIEEKSELVKVQDGAKCKVSLMEGHEVNFTIVHSVATGGTTSEFNILDGIVNNSTDGGNREFQLLPTCYFEKLLEHFDLSAIYVDKSTPQGKAIDWLLSETITRNSDCSSPFFIERYALAVAYVSAAYQNLDNTSYIEWPDEMAMHEAQCSWENVLCSRSQVLTLDLARRSFVGTIATEFALLTKLKTLNLARNQLNGTIPTELGSISNLEELYLEDNQLSGNIPSQLGLVPSLKQINVEINKLNGTIPPELGTLSALKWISFPSNQLTGSIPTELGLLLNLEDLEFYSNQLTGSIPTELGLLLNLDWLDFYSNQLTGSISTELGLLLNLDWLDFSSNQLTGRVPTEIGLLSNLPLLLFGKNQLNGSIPIELGNISNLEVLWLNDNQLTGRIPENFGTLSNLQLIHLENNYFTGNVDPIFCRDDESSLVKNNSVVIYVDSDKVNCTCCVGDSPTFSPAPTATASPTGEPCPVVPAGKCSTCGEGKCVRNPFVTFRIALFDRDITCQEGEALGLSGILSLEDCKLFRETYPEILSLCGCA